MPRRRNPGMDGGPNKGGKWKPDWKPDGGGNGGGGKNPPKRKGGKPEGFKDARRDVMLSVKPLRREIRRVRKQGTRDAQNQITQTQNVYDAMGRTMAPLTQQYTDQSSQIASGLTGNLGTLTDMLGSAVPGVPQSEQSAGANLFGTIGAGSLGELASQAQRNVGYNTSAQRQGAMESGITQRNILQDLGDFRDDLGQQRIDLMRDVPALIRQRMDAERDTNFEQGLAMSELDLRRLMANRSNSLAQQSLGMDQRQQQLYAQMMADIIGAEQGGRR